MNLVKSSNQELAIAGRLVTISTFFRFDFSRKIIGVSVFAERS